MKKMLNTAFVYSIAAMAGGVFYREFTKFNGFSGWTALGFVHTHLFLLGMVFFLVLYGLSFRIDLERERGFRAFYIVYNAGVALTCVMLAARGILQTTGASVSKALDAGVSGISGIGHILTGTGIVLIFLCMRRAHDKRRAEE